MIITLYGSGLINMPIPEDVEEVKVKGALYTMEDGSIDVSIGSTEKAIVLYKTGALTRKQDVWDFSAELLGPNNNVTVAMPADTILQTTEPDALIESEEVLMLYFHNTSFIQLRYYFPAGIEEPPEPGPDPTPEPYTEGPEKIIYASLVVSLAVSAFALVLRRKEQRKKNKQNIMKTLSTNEKKIAEVLLEHKGEIKRNKLENITGISKSSLAAGLKNLERK